MNQLLDCYLCRADHELFYGGEAVLGASHDAPQSYTCPFCARLGFTESSLVEHVAGHHGDAAQVSFHDCTLEGSVSEVLGYRFPLLNEQILFEPRPLFGYRDLLCSNTKTPVVKNIEYKSTNSKISCIKIFSSFHICLFAYRRSCVLFVPPCPVVIPIT